MRIRQTGKTLFCIQGYCLILFVRIKASKLLNIICYPANVGVIFWCPNKWQLIRGVLGFLSVFSLL
jgi:hypothetical protein